MWKCKCDCGNEIIASGKNLRAGRYVSCGCAKSEYLTRYNLTHGGSYKGRRDENGKSVILIDLDGLERRFATIQDAAIAVGGDYRNISACCNGKRQTAYGFSWKWATSKMDGERKEATP